MLLLAIDTSRAAVTAAFHDGRRVLGRAETLDARGHAEHLAPMIDSALAQTGVAPGDLTVVAVGVGPGPFTGLRVGLVTAKVLALALGVPVHGVCSLDALAHGALAGAGPDVADPDGRPERGTSGEDTLGEGREFLVASDARRREVYWARYTVRDGLPRRQGPPRVDSPAALPGGLPVVGRGAVLYGERLGPALEPREVHAADLARVAVRGLAGEDGLLLPPEPLYLRRPDATVPGAPKRVIG
jgi:tRNA threonylcarbamoyladenosine biosynthesis protein TsaB